MMEYLGTDQIGWVAIIVAFLTLEFKALFNKERGDTWSEVLRYLFGFSTRQQATGWRRRIRQGSFWVLAIWFTGHISMGW